MSFVTFTIIISTISKGEIFIHLFTFHLLTLLKGTNELCIPFCEVYDPSTGVWSNIPNMHRSRAKHQASLLPNGMVFVSGGCTNLCEATNTTELYDPSTETWTLSEKMHFKRQSHTASILTNGNILVTGGAHDYNEQQATNTTELYDSSKATWKSTDRLDNFFQFLP